MKWSRRILVAGGLAVIATGLVGVLRPASVDTAAYLRFLSVALLLGDFVVMPVVLVLGAVAARTLPGWAKAPVQAASYISAAVIIVSLPLLAGSGRAASLPSALPRDYPRGLMVVLAAVWAAAAVSATVRLRFRRAGGSRNGTRP